MDVSSLKVRKLMKPSNQNESIDIIECVNSCLTRTKVDWTVCKPCESRVNKVNVMFNCIRPYKTVQDRTCDR